MSQTPRDLKSDCTRCSALCCVAPSFEQSAEFAFAKAANTACPNLTAACRCAVHASLPARGFSGCVAYECYGAGQRVTQEIYAGATWLSHPDLADEIFDVFLTVRGLHEMMAVLAFAAASTSDSRLQADLEACMHELDCAGSRRGAELRFLNVGAYRKRYAALLERVRAS